MDTIGGYKIIRKLGEGSIGLVYLVEDAQGNQFAIKTFHVTDSTGEEEWAFLRKVLVRGAHYLQEMDHKNIVKVHKLYNDKDDDIAYLVMEYVDGIDLKRYLAEKRPDPDLALNWLGQAASALDYAHDHQMKLIHRDVKPSNMLLTTSQMVLKLTDFDIARRQVASDSSLGKTLFGNIKVGTPNYRSPEQIRTPLKITAAADQYSLAAVAFELLTGELPFTAPDISSLDEKILNAAPPKASHISPALPAAVDRVFFKALDKTPGRRFASCGDFVLALQEAMKGRDVTRTRAWHWWVGAAAVLLMIVLIFLWPKPETKIRQTRNPVTTTGPPIVPEPAGLKPTTSPRSSGGDSGSGKPAKGKPSNEVEHSPVPPATAVPSPLPVFRWGEAEWRIPDQGCFVRPKVHQLVPAGYQLASNQELQALSGFLQSPSGADAKKQISSSLKSFNYAFWTSQEEEITENGYVVNLISGKVSSQVPDLCAYVIVRKLAQ